MPVDPGAGGARSLRRVLGVDLGLKRTGLALSDPLGLSVRPLENLTPRSRQEDVSTLVALCAEHEVEAVVVGLPRMPRSGDEGAMARRARGFATALASALDRESPNGAPVFLVDETGSSRLAQERLVASHVPRSKRKAALDTEAARVLVEHFLSGDRGEEVSPQGLPGEDRSR